MPNLSQELLKYLKYSLEEIRNIYSIFMQNINLLGLSSDQESYIRHLNEQAMQCNKEISDNPDFVRSLVRPIIFREDKEPNINVYANSSVKLLCELTDFMKRSNDLIKSPPFFKELDSRSLTDELSVAHFKVIFDLAEPFKKLKLFIEKVNKDITGLEHAKQQLKQNYTFEDKDIENCFIILLKTLPSLIKTCDKFINICNRFNVDCKLNDHSNHKHNHNHNRNRNRNKA